MNVSNPFSAKNQALQNQYSPEQQQYQYTLQQPYQQEHTQHYQTFKEGEHYNEDDDSSSDDDAGEDGDQQQ
jgi:hypothetical protein